MTICWLISAAAAGAPDSAAAGWGGPGNGRWRRIQRWSGVGIDDILSQDQVSGQTTFYLKTWERFLTTDILGGWYNIRAEKVEALLPGTGGGKVSAM
jgi:hypothetical protein